MREEVEGLRGFLSRYLGPPVARGPQGQPQCRFLEDIGHDRCEDLLDSPGGGLIVGRAEEAWSFRQGAGTHRPTRAPELEKPSRYAAAPRGPPTVRQRFDLGRLPKQPRERTAPVTVSPPAVSQDASRAVRLVRSNWSTRSSIRGGAPGGSKRLERSPGANGHDVGQIRAAPPRAYRYLPTCLHTQKASANWCRKRYQPPWRGTVKAVSTTVGGSCPAVLLDNLRDALSLLRIPFMGE